MNQSSIANHTPSALYEFLRANHRFEAFEGRAPDRWSDYAESVTRSYRQLLERRGFARIPGCESHSGQPVFFDEGLRLLDGDRLQHAQAGRFLNFDQRLFTAKVSLSPYQVQTTSMGECVMGVLVTFDAKNLALVWARTNDAGAESRVLQTIDHVVCNSQSAAGFTTLIGSKRSDVCVELFS
jgi:hypothetical protein